MRFRIRIQRLSKALLVPFAIVIATGFGSAPVQAGDKIRCIFPFWFGFAPVFVAQEEGYFASEDLEVTTSFDNDRANVLPAMSTGAIECTMRTIGESMSRPRRADTTGTIIGTIDISVGADGVVASGDIKSIEDLLAKLWPVKSITQAQRLFNTPLADWEKHR